MDRQSLDKLCERGILALVLAILVFGPLAMGAVDPWAFLLVQGLTMAVMLVWAFRLWISPNTRFFWPPICWPVLAFAIYAIGRYLTADIEYIARMQMIQVLMYSFLFFAIINNFQRPERAQHISFTLIFLAAGISGYAVYQFLAHSDKVWIFTSPYTGRGSGTYISPNDFAGFLEMLLPLGVAYALAGRVKPLTRALLIYATVMMMAGLTVTLSRGGWVAAAVGLLAVLMVLVYRRDHRLPALCLLILLLAGGILFVTKYLPAALNFARRADSSKAFAQLDWSVRRDMWGAAVHMWRDHFWWGVGPGLYDYRFSEYRPESLQMRPGWAHNDYLNLLSDWGTVGGLIVLAGMAALGAGLLKTWKYVRPAENDFNRNLSNRFAFYLGAASGLLALSVHSALDFNLHIPANAILGVALLALLTGHLRFAESDRSRAPLHIKALATALLAAGVVYLGWQEWRQESEQYWLARAKSLKDFPPARAAALEKAFAVEPMNFQTAYNIGEFYREQSFHNEGNYQALARQAMEWYTRGMQLDRYDGYNYLRYGMCLDWLGQYGKSGPYYSRAEALDPNGYFTAANIGWHYVQTGDYAAARSWLARSLRLYWSENVIARSYLQIVDQKLVEEAAKGSPLRPGF